MLRTAFIFASAFFSGMTAYVSYTTNNYAWLFLSFTLAVLNGVLEAGRK